MGIRITTRGRIVIQAAVCHKHGWQLGTRLLVRDEGDHIVLVPVIDVHPLITVDAKLSCPILKPLSGIANTFFAHKADALYLSRPAARNLIE